VEKKGRLFIITGPSGSGKTTIRKVLLQQIPGSICPITTTSRQPRPGEVNGQDYFFVSKKEFMRLENEGAFLEWAYVYGNFYGTLRKEIEEKCISHRVLISIHDIQGVKTIIREMPGAIVIFINPDNIDDLQKRIKERQIGPDDIEQRVNVMESELAQKGLCHHIVVNKNGKLEETVADVWRIITSYLPK